MAPAIPAGYAASTAPSGLQMPGGAKMSAVPNLNSAQNTGQGVAPATAVPAGMSLGAPATPGGLTTTPAPTTDQGGSSAPSTPTITLNGARTAPGAVPPPIAPVTLPTPIVGNSGATVDPGTGGVVAPPPANNTGVNTGSGITPAATVPDGLNLGGTQPPVPVIAPPAPTPPANPNDITDINSGYYTSPELKAAQEANASLQNMTPEEQVNQQAINDLEASAGVATANTEHQPIPLEFITGQAKAIEDRRLALEAPLSAKAALLQAKRTAALTASKTALDQAQAKQTAFQEANKPVSTALGTSLTFPGTGKQVGGLAGGGTNAGDATNGATDAQILGYLEAAGINTTRYNIPGLISAIRAGASAQDIIAGKANVAGQTAGAAAAASNKSQYMVDGNGNLIEVTPKVAGAGASTTSGLPNPTKSGAFSAKSGSNTDNNGTTFTLGSDGKTVMANGQAIDLPTFKQMTGQQNVADNKVDFSAIQSSKKTAPATTAPKTTTQNNPSSNTALSGSAQQYFLSGDISKTGLGSANSRNQLNTQVSNYAKSLGIDNWSAAKVAALNAGDAANYAKQVDYLTTTQRSVSNAENGFKQVLSQFPDLNKVGSPLWNKTANELASTLTGGQRNAFEAGLTEIANEYSQVFSRGGANTVSAHSSASDIVNGNLSMKDLQGVLTELQAQGKIVVDGARSTVNGILNGFGTGNTSNPNGHKAGDIVPGGDGKQYKVGTDGNYYPIQ